MLCVWQQVVFSGVVFSLMFNAVNCRSAQISDENNRNPRSSNYSLQNACEKSNPVKVWCDTKSEKHLILQNDPICGLVISEEITTGPKTKINEFPWMALLQYTNDLTIESFCQGTLISDVFVVTTATCITRTPNGLELRSVRLGEWDKSTTIDCDESSGVKICNNVPVVVPIEETIIHRYFDESRAEKYNMGLIRLKQKVEFTDFIKPICVPHYVFSQINKFVHNGRKFEIAGWGEATQARKKSEILLKVDLEGFLCPSGSAEYLCVQGTRRRNVCQEDEGAPIMGRVTLGKRPYVYLAGIVSQNNNCGAETEPILLEDIENLRFLSPGDKFNIDLPPSFYY